MITALDATALIYAMQPGSRRPEEMESQALVHAYVDWLKVAQQDEIQIPAPAYSEFLAFYASEDQQAQIAAVLKRGFVVTPLDEDASVRAAAIWLRTGGKAFLKRMKKNFDISKQCVKSDILIVATALAHGANRIITADAGVIETSGVVGLSVLRPQDCIIPNPEVPEASAGRLFE